MASPSADAARDAVARTIVALERACLDADRAFSERRWPGVRSAFRAQSELTAELGRIFAETPDVAEDAKVVRRVQGVYAFRDEQLRRMRAYRDEVGERLRTIGKMKAFSRAVGRRVPRIGVVDGQY